jgi:CubicO group peptidase (beta-lactamase class C family)
MAHYKIPGLGIALVNSGKIEWARGYGVARAGGSQPVTVETRFQAASISKPVSAVGALRLVDAGKLDLDKDLNRQLTSWKVPENAFTRQTKPTLRFVLSHSAGFTVHGFGGYEAGSRLPRLIDILNGRAPANSAPIRVEFVPGTKMQYSGGGYTVMQRLIMDVTGKSFAAVLQEQVLGPIEMKHSAFEQPPTPGFEAAAAQAHVDGKPLPGRWHVYPEMAAAGLWTTPSDLARLVIAVQRAKAGGRNSILSPKMIGEMLRHQPGGWGLGPGVTGSGNSAQFNHSGSNTGFECLMIGFVNTGQGAVLMANSNGTFELLNELAGSLRVEYGWPD